LAWPVILAQAASALTGVVDTAAITRVGTAVDIAAVAIASVAFSFLYWGFGFLRMSTTGLTAQASGAGDDDAVRAVLLRALVIGGTIGCGLILAAPWLQAFMRSAFHGDPTAEEGARAYFVARIGGAPAALMGFAVNGWLIGTGRTRSLLMVQVLLNGTNAVLDATFVALGWGPAGIGLGTAIAEWVALGLGLTLVRDALRRTPGVFDKDALRATFSANRDVMLRTLALLFSFAWFVDAGARLGPATLGGNQVLLQLVSVSAFVLDAFAFVSEKEVGEAIGGRDRARLGRAIRVTSGLAVVGGLAFAVIFALGGGLVIRSWVADPGVAEVALRFLPACALVPLIGVAAWQLDGIFLGATAGRALRWAALAAALAYVSTDLVLRHAGWENLGVWVAFLAMYVYRTLGLAVALPGLLARVAGPPALQDPPLGTE